MAIDRRFDSMERRLERKFEENEKRNNENFGYLVGAAISIVGIGVMIVRSRLPQISFPFTKVFTR